MRGRMCMHACMHACMNMGGACWRGCVCPLAHASTAHCWSKRQALLPLSISMLQWRNNFGSARGIRKTLAPKRTEANWQCPCCKANKHCPYAARPASTVHVLQGQQVLSMCCKASKHCPCAVGSLQSQDHAPHLLDAQQHTMGGPPATSWALWKLLRAQHMGVQPAVKGTSNWRW